jgi:hypothetical protein
MRRHSRPANALVLIVFLASSFACRFGAPTASPVPATATAARGAPTQTLAPAPTKAQTSAGASAITLDLSQPFFSTTVQTWSPAPYAGPVVSLPIDLSSVVNPEVLAGLTAEQKAFLAKNGFVVMHSQEAQFNDIRHDTANVNGQPYFRTVDEAFHALHLLFDDLLKALERQMLRPQISAMLTATRDQVHAYANQAQGTSIEADTALAEAYLEVAIHLFDPSAPPAQVMPEEVDAQLKQIMDASGRDDSALIPDFEDDYGAYKPVGHYAGDPDLESYFRGMSWLGRVHFPLGKAEDPSFTPSRAPVIITLALRQAQVSGQPAAQIWSDANRLLDFLVGPTDDLGPFEYSALMDSVYGPDMTFSDLADDNMWQTFLASTDDLPAPQINSTFLDWSSEMEVEKGWRLMGQRFTMDANIFQNLIFDKVDMLPDGTKRQFPTGLDVAAVFGSDVALNELEKRGDLIFPNYPENLDSLKQAAAAQPESEWLGRSYSAWLYSFLPVVAPKDNAFPDFMQTDAWGYKDVNAVLGSWAELKHDTVLYSKMPEGMGGGGPPTSGPPPNYVEPNPLAFYRMAYVARAIGEGVQIRVDSAAIELESPSFPDLDVGGGLFWMTRLGESLDDLGTVAAHELAGEDIGDLRYAASTCLGFHECSNIKLGYGPDVGVPPEVPIVAAVSGAGESVLEAATGYVDRIYVVVPLEGGLEVAQGGVFSYYEFIQPRSNRLTDDEWRQQLDDGTAPDRPEWAKAFSLEGGQATDALRFRVGDVYYVTEAGDRYNMRASPSTNAPVVGVLGENSYVTIIDGPVESGGYRWWQIECTSCGYLDDSRPEQAWLVENSEWLARSY